jgi:putative glutamine amidotransferase
MNGRINAIISISLVFSILIFITSCNHSNKEPMKIAVTKASKNYINWLKQGDSALIPIDMYTMEIDTALESLNYCAGLLVTGGEDIQPEYYGQAGEKYLCKEMDPRRDTLEIALIKKAIELRMPVLGICRGEQMLNVTLGG